MMTDEYNEGLNRGFKEGFSEALEKMNGTTTRLCKEIDALKAERKYLKDLVEKMKSCDNCRKNKGLISEDCFYCSGFNKWEPDL